MVKICTTNISLSDLRSVEVSHDELYHLAVLSRILRFSQNSSIKLVCSHFTKASVARFFRQLFYFLLLQPVAPDLEG